MSTPQGQVVRYSRASRRRKGVPDLNFPLVIENLEQALEPAASVPQGGQTGVTAIPIAGGGPNHQPAGSAAPAPIDVDDLDDDVVIISSPRALRALEEASKNLHRSRAELQRSQIVVIDDESEETVPRHTHNQANKRRRGPPNPPVINCELYVNLEGSSGSMRQQPRYVAPPPPPPPPPEPVSCPICMGPFVEEVTTKCGHIFCKTCIELAIKAQHKCPTCRRKLTNKMFFRVFLPTSK